MITNELLNKYPRTKNAFAYINTTFGLYRRTYAYITANFDEDYLRFSEQLITDIQAAAGPGREHAGLDAFIKISTEFLVLQASLIKTGAYARASFNEVLDSIYLNETVMVPYMEGLLYSQIFWPNHYTFGIYFLKAIARLGPVSRVLDVPVGDGIFVYYMAAHLSYGRLDAFDISHHAIGFAQRFLGASGRPLQNVTIACKNVFDLEASTPYDLIVCGELLEHLEDPRALLAKLKELLAKDGTLFLSTAVFAAAVDHIYLFNNARDVHVLLRQYFTIESELILPISLKAHDPSLHQEAVNYACILRNNA